jgi:hypothetical protein
MTVDVNRRAVVWARFSRPGLPPCPRPPAPRSPALATAEPWRSPNALPACCEA